MKKYVITYSLTFMLMLLVGTLLTQCSDEEYASDVRSDVICFGSPELEAWQSGSGNSETRGTIVTTKNFADIYSEYKVFAWVADQSTDASKKVAIPYIMGEDVSSGSNRFMSDHFWPGAAYKVYFLSFAPAEFAKDYKIEGSKIQIDYTVPEDVEQQKDIVCEYDTVAGNRNSSYKLSFKHLLTAVQIKFADESQMENVSSVSLENVYSKATLSRSILSTSSPGWKSQNTPFTFTSSNKSGKYIANGEYTFMMLPQTFNDVTADNANAAIVVTFEDGTSVRKLLSETTLKKWRAYYRVTYTINYDATISVLEVPEAVDMAADDVSMEIPVVSEKRKYYLDDDGSSATKSVENLEWEVDQIPDWLTEDNKTDGSLSLRPTDQIAAVTGDEAIQGREPVSDYDLSGSPMNTANCYIVNQAGTYKFPLVYGNALKNGCANVEAYAVSGYLNHLGNPITSPYIYENDGCTPASVKLLWQDRKGLIKRVSLSDNNTYISFETASKDDIGQGNAKIAVCDSKGTIMWSWHIWVTFYIPNQEPKIGDDWRDKKIIPRTAGTKSEYIIMPINLGWCDECKYYAGREGEVVLSQPSTGLTRTVKVFQRSKVEGVFGSQPFYQWCRKDPFMAADVSQEFNIQPVDGSHHETFPDKKSYDIDGELVTFETAENLTMSTSIQNPDAFCIGTAMMWEGNTPWQYTFKTIYDPSPAGYKLVESETMSVISTDNVEGKIEEGNINTPFTNSQFNDYRRYPEVHVSNGWVFYCYPKLNGKVDPSGGTFFMPISLFRQYSKGNNAGKALYDNGTRNHFYGSGTVWITKSSNPTAGTCAGFYGHHVNCDTGSSNRLYGRAVRCMKE